MFILSRILAENDAALARTSAEATQLETQLELSRATLEKEASEEAHLQQRLSTELRDKMTHEKAAEFSEKLTNRMSHLKVNI